MIRSLTLIAVLACTTTHAQTYFGLRSGWNQSSYDSDELWAFGKRNTFHLGGAFSVGDPGSSGLSLELYLSGRGATDVQWDLGYYGLPEQTEADHNLLYLDLPLMFRLGAFGEGFFFESGLYASFLLNAKVSGGGLTSTETDRIADGYKGTHFGFIAGLGYVHHSGIGASMRGSISFGDVYEEKLPSTPIYYAGEERKTQFQLVQVSLLYYFDLDRW